MLNVLRKIKDYLVIKRSGLFDAEYYLLNYPDVRRADVNPLWHFVSVGWKERRNPSEEFNTLWYLENYTDVKNSGVNPLFHYIRFGKIEGRGLPFINIAESSFLMAEEESLDYEFSNEIKDFLSSVQPVEEGYVFISHDASETGAPINLLNICKAYKQKYGNNFVIITIREGGLKNQFTETGPTLTLDKSFKNVNSDSEIISLFTQLRLKGFRNCIVNSIVSATLKSVLDKTGMFSVYLIHELPKVISILGLNEVKNELIKGNSQIVFAAEFVAKQFFNTEKYPYSRVHIIPQGVRQPMIFDGDSETARDLLSETLRTNLENKKVVLGCGEAQYLKGTDLFVDTLSKLLRNSRDKDFEFIWLGNKSPSFQEWYEIVYPTLPFHDKLHFIDYVEDPAYFFKAADVFLLTSRSDSYPSVALEALANGIPVLMFKGTSGIEEVIDETNGMAVDAFDTYLLAQAILDIGERQPNSNLKYPVAGYDIYLEKIIKIFDDF